MVEHQAQATNHTVESQGAQLSAMDLRIGAVAKAKPTTPSLSTGFCGDPDPWQSYGRSGAAATGANPSNMSLAGSSTRRPESIGSAFSAIGDDNDLGVVMAQQYRLPTKRRRSVVLEGFPRNTDRNITIGKLGEYTALFNQRFALATILAKGSGSAAATQRRGL